MQFPSVIAVLLLCSHHLAAECDVEPVVGQFASDGSCALQRVSKTSKRVVTTEEEFPKEPPKKPEIIGRVPNPIQQTYEVVQTVNKGSSEAAEAEQLKTEENPNIGQVQEVLNKAEEEESVEDALHNGNYMTEEDLEKLGLSTGCGNYSWCFEGDLRAESEEQLAMLQAKDWTKRELWSGAEIKYCFAHTVRDSVKHTFRLAVQQISRAVPCFQFTEVALFETSKDCTQTPAILVQSQNSGCWSYLGREKYFNSQPLNIMYNGCNTLGTVLHEILHALGVLHEQQREDRDDYVKIHWDNLYGAENFKTNPLAHTGIRYDYTSIMHYGAHAFAKDDNKPTISTVDGTKDHLLGQKWGLAQSDANSLAAMYKAVNPSCLANAVARDKTGCTDSSDWCASLSQCTDSIHYWDCCGCGGGYTHQCFDATSTCTYPQRLPRRDFFGECIEDLTYWYHGYDCVVWTRHCTHNLAVAYEHSLFDYGKWHYFVTLEPNQLYSMPKKMCQGQMPVMLP